MQQKTQNIRSCYSCPMQNNDHCRLKMVDVFHSVVNKDVFVDCPLREGVFFKAITDDEQPRD
jgi:hypothetical protein